MRISKSGNGAKEDMAAQMHYISSSGNDFFRQDPGEGTPDVSETMGEAPCHDFQRWQKVLQWETHASLDDNPI